MQHEHIDFTIRNFAPEAKVTIQLWCNTASNSLVDPQSKAFHSAFKKKLHSGCCRGRKYKLSPWVNASGDKANVLKLRLVPLKSRHRLSFSHQDEKDFCEYTTGILPAMCRNYMSKNTFCCGDKIPILVHTCGSTERNYAFLFYY